MFWKLRLKDKGIRPKYRSKSHFIDLSSKKTSPKWSKRKFKGSKAFNWATKSTNR
jgi:hypothetical protein